MSDTEDKIWYEFLWDGHTSATGGIRLKLHRAEFELITYSGTNTEALQRRKTQRGKVEGKLKQSIKKHTGVWVSQPIPWDDPKAFRIRERHVTQSQPKDKRLHIQLGKRPRSMTRR